MSDDAEADLLEAVRRDPSDDEARLVYADWLEESDDVRGEYLRLEVEMHRLPARMAELHRVIDPGWLMAVGRRYCVVLHGTTPNKIGAIRLVRELTGLGLREAKDVIDDACSGTRRVIARDLEYVSADRIAKQFVAGLSRVESEPFEGKAGELTPRAPIVTNAPQRKLQRAYRCVLVSVDAAFTLEAVKRVREAAGFGIKQAKDLVDAVLAGTPSQLRARADARTAADTAVAFAEIGEVRIENAAP